MIGRAALGILLVLCIGATYTLDPEQSGGILRYWTSDGETGIQRISANTFDGPDNIVFVAMNTDDDTAYDRGGVPEEKKIALYPVGELHIFSEDPISASVDCANPTQPVEKKEKNTHILVLPAGDCLLTLTYEEETQVRPVSVTANDVQRYRIKSDTLPIWLLILLLLIIALGALLLVQKKSKKIIPKEVLKVLRKNDRRVLKYIFDNGPVLAGVVRKELDMPKTSFHRVIGRLQEKGLLRTEEYGNTQKLSWDETFQVK